MKKFWLLNIFGAMVPAAAATLMTVQVSAAVIPSTGSSNFIYGTNGHLINSTAYYNTHISDAEKMKLLKDAGLTAYRVDVLQKDVVPHLDQFLSLFKAAKDNGIQILPMLAPDVLATDGLATVEKKSYAFGEQMARIGSLYNITHYELLNEKDVACMRALNLTYDLSGESVKHYDDTCTRRAVAMINGLHKGIKSVNGSFKTLAGYGGYKHHGFLQKMKDYGVVNYDLMVLHWYSGMGERLLRDVVYPILETYKKDIWITEFNHDGGSASITGATRYKDGTWAKDGQGYAAGTVTLKENEQANYTRKFAVVNRRYPRVKAIFAYELLDQPYLGPVNSKGLSVNSQSHYGLVTIKRSSTTNKWTVDRLKPAYTRMKLLAGVSKVLDQYENRAVEHLYQLYLNRAPDSLGRAFHVAQMRGRNYFDVVRSVRDGVSICQKDIYLLPQKYMGRVSYPPETRWMLGLCETQKLAAIEQLYLNAGHRPQASSAEFLERLSNRVMNETLFLSGASRPSTLQITEANQIFQKNRYGKEAAWTTSAFEDYTKLSPAVLAFQIRIIYLQYIGRDATSHEIAFWSENLFAKASFLNARKSLIGHMETFLNSLTY